MAQQSLDAAPRKLHLQKQAQQASKNPTSSPKLGRSAASMRAWVAKSITSTSISASHLASRASPTQYLPAKLTPQRLLGLCLHSTHCGWLHPWFLLAGPHSAVVEEGWLLPQLALLLRCWQA